MAADRVGGGTKPEKDESVIPLAAEEVSIAKRRVVTGHVTVSTVTRLHEELVDTELAHEHVEIERTPIGRRVEAIPDVRQEGDTTIVPVVEETLALEHRLILKEEVRIRRVHGTEKRQQRVMLRKQEAVITRLPEEQSLAGGHEDSDQQSHHKQKE
jgi:uncharacterized protein (TIGR02271 family)